MVLKRKEEKDMMNKEMNKKALGTTGMLAKAHYNVLIEQGGKVVMNEKTAHTHAHTHSAHVDSRTTEQISNYYKSKSSFSPRNYTPTHTAHKNIFAPGAHIPKNREDLPVVKQVQLVSHRTAPKYHDIDTITTTYTDALKMITDEQLHVKITKSIIRKIASNPKHHSNVSCMQIVNSGYTDSIFEDLTQEIFITLFELYNNGLLTVEDNKLVFATYTDNNDNEKSHYLDLYKTLEKYLYGNKQKDISRPKKRKDGSIYYTTGTLYYDSYTDSKEVTIKSKEYIHFLKETAETITLEDLSNNGLVQELYRTIKRLYPKHYINACNILQCRYNEMTIKETAEFLHLSRRQVERVMYDKIIPCLKSIQYDRYINDVEMFGTVNHVPQTPTKQDWKDYKPKKEKSFNTPSIPVQETITEYEKKAFEKVKQEKQDALELVGNTKHMVSNKGIHTINGNGEQVRFTPWKGCIIKSNDNIKKFSKRTGTPILYLLEK